MRPYVQEITASIKGSVNAKLGPKTLVIGKNGAGKSAVCNAIELALTGSASDIAGRAVLAKDSDLFALLAPPGEKEVSATARLSDKDTARWELAQNHRAERSGPQAIFPLRDVRAAILGSAETARKFVLEQAGAALSWDDVLALVPSSLHGKLEGMTLDGAHTSTPGRLVLTLEAARGYARIANASVKAARESCRQASQGLGPPPTDAEIEASRGKNEVAEGQAARISKLIDSLAEQATTLSEQIVDLEAQANAVGPGMSPAVQTVLAAIEVHVSAGAKQCACCGQAVDASVFTSRGDALRAKLATSIKAAELRDVAKKALEGARREKNAVLIEIDRHRGMLTDLEKVAAASAPDPTLVERRARWASIRKQEEQALQAERDATTWTQLADACADAMGKLLGGASAAFEQRVQAFLPKDDHFGLDLIDGEREVFRVGLRRNGKLHSALSGAEWARVTAALALSCSSDAPASMPVIVIPEERAFDPDTLSSVLQAFTAADAQVIITSPVEPRTIPEGWTTVRVGEGMGLLQIDDAPRKEVPVIVTTEAPATPVKRGRGRPRKAQNVAAAPAPAAPTTPANGSTTLEDFFK